MADLFDSLDEEAREEYDALSLMSYHGGPGEAGWMYADLDEDDVRKIADLLRRLAQSRRDALDALREIAEMPVAEDGDAGVYFAEARKIVRDALLTTSSPYAQTAGSAAPGSGVPSGEKESVEGAGAAVDGARSAQATRPAPTIVGECKHCGELLYYSVGDVVDLHVLSRSYWCDHPRDASRFAERRAG